MGSFAAGSVVLVRFPFSDLSHSKLRPAIVLGASGRGDWLLCQLTSNPYSDARAIPLTEKDFRTGSLHRASYARPAKLFTAHESLVFSEIAVLREESLGRIIDAIIQFLRPGP